MMPADKRPVLRAEREMVDVTMGGILHTRRDTDRRQAPGLMHYYADDVEVSAEEFARLAQAEMDRHDTEDDA